jgi:peptide/nickel transport system ATP-binding protein
MIFQEPMTALNPVLTVGQQISESLFIHRGMSAAGARRQAATLLASVKIPDPESRLDQYPHQLSGGMRQRVMIAIALACSPGLLIADEPTTALDVTVQAQIFDLLREIQSDRGNAVILITHDMGVISEMADRVAVMYGGHIVEEGSTDEILARPRHPYTQGLIACIPVLGSGQEERPPLVEIPGVVPSIWELSAGCPFAQRCAYKRSRCIAEMPPFFETRSDHRSACWLEDEAAAGQEVRS